MKTVRDNKRAQQGFTLVELMVVVAIVAILAGIALPSYRQHVVKTHRSDAMATLQVAAQSMERYSATHNGSYAGAVAGTDFPAQSPADGDARYTLSVDDLTDTTYTLIATPVAGGSQEDDGIIQLSNTGARGWDKDDSGDIGAGENNWNSH